MLLISSYQKASFVIINKNNHNWCFFLPNIVVKNEGVPIMNIDTIFTATVYILLLISIILVIRTYIVIQIDVNLSAQRYADLRYRINSEQRKNKVNKHHIEYVEEYSDTLVDRLFIIIKDILFTQKLIFEKEDK